MRKLTVLLGSLLAVVPTFATPSLSLAQTAPCAVQSLQYQLTCYGPDQVGAAKARFAGHAIVPRAIVRRVTGLALTDAELGRRILPTPGHQTIFGLVFGSPLSQAPPSANGQATWVEVDEYPTEFKGLKGVKMWRVTESNNGGPLTTLSWNLQENVPSRKLGLQIGTDGSKSVVRQIGSTVLQRAAGKGAGAAMPPVSVTAQLGGLRLVVVLRAGNTDFPSAGSLG